MNCLKPIRAMFMVTPLIIPTLALSEPVTIEYSSRAELVMLAPENASFECTSDDRPAQLEITEDMWGSVATNFPTTFLDQSELPESNVRIRYGNELVPERAISLRNRLRNNHWNTTTSGIIDFCVGPAILKVVGGSLNIFANLGQYEASVISSDNVLKDLDIEYVANTSGIDPILFINSVIDVGEADIFARRIIRSDPHINERTLGLLNINANQLAVRFINQNDLDDVTHPTRLNVRLLLVEPSLTSESLVVVHEGNGEADD